MKNSNILANGQINIESILLNWTNLIISKQISEYKKYIGSSNSKIENFSKMSQRVIENISKERRKAIIVIAKDVSPSPTLHLRPGSSMPATNRYETLFEHSRCTDKIKVCSRCKEIEDKKQQLKNPKVTKDLQDLLINDKKHDLSEINIRRNKKLYTIFNGTLYFRESCYHQLSSLDQICENNYSRLLLVLSFLIPEYFIDFKKTWLDTKITDVRYEELVILREEINMWSKKRKVNLLMTIINKLEYNVFDGDIKYESKDDDQTSESEESDSKYEYCLKMPFHQVEEKCNKSKEKNSSLRNSVFYFSLLYKLFKSPLNKVNFDDQVISYSKVEQNDVPENKPKKTITYSSLEYKPEKVSYNIVLQQKDIDVLNNSDLSKDNISNVKNMFQFIANNQNSSELILQSLCKID